MLYYIPTAGVRGYMLLHVPEANMYIRQDAGIMAEIDDSVVLSYCGACLCSYRMKRAEALNTQTANSPLDLPYHRDLCESEFTNSSAVTSVSYIRSLESYALTVS